MIKFFRQKRQRLLSENKFSKYLIYAFGEIVLVVIGILIALSINTWNEKRIIRIKSHSYLSEIINDLKTDTLALRKGILRHERIVEFKDLELRKSDFTNTSIFNLENLIEPSIFKISPLANQAYQKIINSGLDKLRINEELSLKINKYYTETMVWHRDLIKWDNELSIKEGEYWYSEQEIYEIRGRSGIPVFQNSEENRTNLIQLIESPKARNLLKRELERRRWFIRQLGYMNRQASELIKEIQKEIGTIEN